MVLEAYGNKCVCCGADDPRTLTLVYVDIDELKRRENDRQPGHGIQEYQWLYRHRFPQNGRRLACRKCCKWAKPGHFPVSGICGANHTLDAISPRWVSKSPNPEVLRIVYDGLAKAGKPMPSTRRGFGEFWDLPQPELDDEEKEFVRLYRAAVHMLYRKFKAKFDQVRAESRTAREQLEDGSGRSLLEIDMGRPLPEDYQPTQSEKELLTLRHMLGDSTEEEGADWETQLPTNVFDLYDAEKLNEDLGSMG